MMIGSIDFSPFPKKWLLIAFLIMLQSPGIQAHVTEGTGNGLQLFSYRLTGTKPVIDGSILSRDGDPAIKDTPAEWKEAYTREILLSDSNKATLFLMNDDDTLYIAVIYEHGNNGNGAGVALYFDEGAAGGNHDDTLTGGGGNNRNEDGYSIFRQGAAHSTIDLSWDGTNWSADGDGDTDFRGNGHFFNDAVKVHMREFAIPLTNPNTDDANNSDLNINLTHELGMYIEVFKTGGGGGTFHWLLTNGLSKDAKSGAGWGDVRLNISKSFFTFYSSVAANGDPTVDGNLSEDAWRGSYRRNLVLTNFNGDIVNATFFSVQNHTTDRVFIGLQIDDPTNDANNYAQIYFEEDGTDGTTTARNYLLEAGQEDALRATGATASDRFWNGAAGWVADTEGADTHAAQGTHNGTSFVYEFLVPYIDGVAGEDINIPDNGVPGLFIRYHDDSRSAGSQEFYWEFATNTDQVNVDPNSAQRLSAGWPNLQFGAPYVQVIFPEDGSNVEGVVNVRIYAKDEGGVTEITSAKIFRASDTANKITLTRIADGGEWSGTWDVSALSNGKDTLVFRVVDDDGITIERLVDVIISNGTGLVTAPTISVTSPTPGSVISGTQTINFTATPGSGTLSSREISVDGAAFVATTTTTTHSLSTASMAEGSHTIQLKAINSGGASSTTQVITYIVKNSPTVTISSPTGGDTVSGIVSVVFASTSPGGFAHTDTVYLDGAPTGATSTDTTHSLNTSGLVDGAHTLQIKSTDNQGRVGLSQLLTLHVGNKPQVTITSPAADSTLSGTIVVAFTGTAVTPATISKSEIRVDGGAWRNTSTSSTDTLDTQPLDEGSHLFQIKVTDSNDKTGLSQILKVVVRNAPSVSITSPTPDSVVSGTIVVEFTATPVAPATISTTEISVDGGAWRNTSTGSTDTLNTTPLMDGSHLLQIRARDNNGKSGVSLLLKIEVRNLPLVTITSPKADSVISGTVIIQFSTAGSSSVPFSTEIAVDGGDWKTTSTDSTDTLDTRTFKEGSHNLQVRATSNNGKVGYSRILKVNIKNSPSVVILSPSVDHVLNGVALILFSVSPVSPDTIARREISAGGGDWIITTTDSTHDLDTKGFVDGNLRYQIRVTDGSGKTGVSKIRELVVDNSPPLLSLPVVKYSGENILGKKGTTLLVTALALDITAGLDPDSGVVFISNAIDTQQVIAVLKDDGKSGDEIKGDNIYSTQVTVNSDSTGSLEYSLRARDSVGNDTTLLSAIELDNTIPQVAYTLEPKPVGVDSIHGEVYVDRLRLVGWASDVGSGLNLIRITVRNDSGLHVNNSPIDITPENGQFSRILNLVVGENTITLIARDKAGNLDSLQGKVVYILPKVTKLIKIKGGTVTSPNGSKVSIPKNALFTNTEITMRVVAVDEEPKPLNENIQLLGLPHEFGPDGLVFRKPVTITLSYNDVHLDPDQDGTDDFKVEDLVLYFWDGNQWLQAGQSTVNDSLKQVSVLVNHFTLYDIGVDTSGKGTTSDGFAAYWTRNPVKESEPGTFVIQYPSTENGNGIISLSIYDMAGDLVNILISKQSVRSAAGRPMWDGQNTAGRFAGAGLYIYVLKYQSSDKKIKKLIRKPVGLLKN